MLKVGDVAPRFAAGSTTGQPISMDAYRGRIVVLYFFRKAFTHFCTIETKGFRDNYDDLRALGAEVVGVSSDDFATQCEFARAHGVSFPMIADSDKSIARAYDIFFSMVPIIQRVTYVIDRRGHVAGIFQHEFQMLKHLDEVLRFVRGLAVTPRAEPPRAAGA